MADTADLSLNGDWTLSFGRQSDRVATTPAELASSGWRSISCQVPGNVELDLHRAGLIQDPSIGENAYALRDYETCDWWFSRRFTAPAVSAGHTVELEFAGVDTLATVFLNGQLIGSTENMFIPHRFDITRLLRRGENELHVRIRSCVLEARGYAVKPGEYSAPTTFEALRLRKAAHMFGWDILPRLVSAGLWRDVKLRVLPPTRIVDVYVATKSVDVARRSAEVLACWNLATERLSVDDLRVRLTVSDDAGQRFQHITPLFGTHGRATVTVNDIDLWYPRGSGPAAMYDFRLDLIDAHDRVLATHSHRIGFRTIELRRTPLTTPDGAGQFVFVVNGQLVFVKGTNWVPLDSLHSRDAKHLNDAFAMLVDLNCNMVRCWGGNVYEDHAFFDLCDRHGVMVWQDFAMGCAVYPQDDAFAAALRNEADAIITRLRNHPSLALWAGNNEGDEAYEWAGTGVDPNHDRPTRRVLPDAVRANDPLRPFLPSSPYRPPEFFAQDRPAVEVLPEQHLWGPRDDYKGAYYTTSAAHFASEIGYHGCPDVDSLKQMMDPAHVWPWQNNPQWLAKAVRPMQTVTRYDYRIPLMASQIALLFGQVPETLEDFVLASQISQAEAFKFFIEHFRFGKWRRTGLLWWNLRDGWPVISDAIVDYYGRRKLAYDFIRRVQTDVCVMIGEPDGERRHPIVAVNDSPQPATIQVTIDHPGDPTPLFSTDARLEPNAPAVTVGTLPASATPAMWRIRWQQNRGQPSQNHYLAGPRPFKLADYRRWLRELDETSRR